MATNNWTALTQALPAWLNAATADISAVLSDIVDNGEKRIFRDFRVPEMETALSVNISGGNAAIPSDFIELKYAYISGAPVTTLEIVPARYIYERYPDRNGGDIPEVIARDGSNFIFGPYPTDGVLKGTYYKACSSIGSGTNNALIAKYGDAYLYASLVESEPMIGRDKRMAIWESKYRLIKDSYNVEADRSRFGSGMQIRVV